MVINAELETSILATAIYRSDRNYFEAMMRLGVNVDSFYYASNRRIFEICKKMLDNGLKPNALSVMAQDGTVKANVIGMGSAAAEHWNFDDNVRTLRDMEAARALHKAGSELLARLMSQQEVVSLEDMQAAVDGMGHCIYTVAANRQDKTLVDIVNEAKERLGSTQRPLPLFHEGTIADDAFCFYPGETMTIAARTGRGKTALTCQFCNLMLEKGFSGIYVCTESSDAEIMERLAAVDSGVPHWKVRMGSRLADEVDRFSASLNKYASEYRDRLTILGLRRRKPNAEDIVRAVRERGARFGSPDFVIVDYIQDLGYTRDMRRMNPRERMEDTVDIIHDCCVEYSCAAIFLSQVNRTGERGERLTEDQIKEAGKIAEKSHIVAFLHRPGGDDEPAEFYSVKCRNTRRFDLRLDWKGTHYESPSNRFDERKWSPAD